MGTITGYNKQDDSTTLRIWRRDRDLWELAINRDEELLVYKNGELFSTLATLEDIVTGTGDMSRAVYDTTNIEADCFDRSNHTNTQAASTISDFDIEVSNNIDVSNNTTHRSDTLNPHSTSWTNLSGTQNSVNISGFNNDSGFEDSTQLDARDTNNRDRTNHTGTQTKSTISDFQHAIDNATDHSAPTDNTNFNATISAHGLLPKLSGSSSEYLDGTGTWSSVSAGVTGPGTSTDNAAARYDGATGSILLDSNLIIGDNGGISTTGTNSGFNFEDRGGTFLGESSLFVDGKVVRLTNTEYPDDLLNINFNTNILTIPSTFYPNVDDSQDVGSASFQWRNVYVGTDVILQGTSLNSTIVSLGTRPLSVSIAASDETTDLSVGTALATFRMPYGMNVTEVRASVTTAPTGSTLQVDINEGGVSILSTPITIDSGEKTSTTAATPPVISDSSLADDAEITIDIDQVGATIAGTGLKITLIGTII